MWYEKTLSIFTKEEFDKHIVNLAYDTVIGDGKYTYDSVTRTFRLKKLAGALPSGLRIPIYNMYKEDIIEIECEYRYISGAQAAFLCRDNLTTDIMRPVNNGEWERIKLSFTLTVDCANYDTNKYLELAAYATTDGGECEISNLIIKFKSKFSDGLYVVEQGENENGNWVKYSDGTMKCWGKKTFQNVPITTPHGSVFYASGSNTPLGQFPKQFKTNPVVHINCYGNEDYAFTTPIRPAGVLELPTVNTFRFVASTLTLTYAWEAQGKWR